MKLTWYWHWDETPCDRERAVILHEFARAGAKFVVLSDFILHSMLSSLSEAARWRRLLNAAGLSFCDAHATYIGGYDDPMSPDHALRRAAAARLRAEFELCAAFGVDTIAVHVGNQTADEPGPDGVRDAEVRLWRMLETVLPAAEDLGVVVCLENIFFPTATPAVLLEAVRRFPSPALGLCWDSGHANIVRGAFRALPNQLWTREAAKCGCDPEPDERVLEKMLPHIVNCHLHDNDGMTDRHWLPGDPLGTIDWKTVVPMLLSAPRLKCVQCESIARSERPYTPTEQVEALNRILPPT